jgi:signal transduction histidine kinase
VTLTTIASIQPAHFAIRRLREATRLCRRWSFVVGLSGLVFCAYNSSSAAAAANAAAEITLLTTAHEIHALTLAEARGSLPVSLTATVTYADPLIVFVADDSGGMFVFSPKDEPPPAFGMVVRVSGVTGAGDFAPVVMASQITPTGSFAEPSARAVSFADLASGTEDCEWVEFSGIVRAVGTNAQFGFAELRMAAGTGRIGVQLAARGVTTNLEQFVDARVRVRGAVGGIFNQKRQLVAPKLFVPSLSQITVEKAAPADLLDVPVRSVKSLLQYTTRSAYGHRVKLLGFVTFSQSPHTVFIRDDTQGLEVQALEPQALQIGDLVEVMGFPAFGEWAPVLEDAMVKKVGTGPLPVVTVITPREALEGDWDSDVVRLEAKLVDYVPRREADVLVLQSDDLIFNALLPAYPGRRSRPPPQKGSDLRLTGICQVQVGGPDRRRQSFRLLLRGAEDLAVIRQPPWWTPARIVLAFTALAAVFLLVLGWVFVLKRRVWSQTRVIREKLQREAVLEERTRIAREFHDTIEQEMIGISMQLDSVRAKLKNAPELALEGLHLAGRMIRRTIGEARRSVMDLRSRALDHGDLGSALEEIARPIISGTAMVLQVRRTGQVRPLPARVEANLLRIGQEAITNAIKHGGAAHITLSLDYQADHVALSVRDDGCGFLERDCEGAAGGRFGLLGMRERAARISAQIEVRSAPHTGTEIRVAAPLLVDDTRHEEPTTIR